MQPFDDFIGQGGGQGFSEQFEIRLAEYGEIWHVKFLPEGEEGDGVVGGGEEGDDGAVGGDDDGLVGVGGDGVVDGRFKTLQGLFGRFEAKDEFGRPFEKVPDLLFELLPLDPAAGPFVFVEVFGRLAGQGQGAGDDLACLGGFGFVAGDDDVGAVLFEFAGQEMGLNTAVFAQLPEGGGLSGVDIGFGVADENEVGHLEEKKPGFFEKAWLQATTISRGNICFCRGGER